MSANAAALSLHVFFATRRLHPTGVPCMSASSGSRPLAQSPEEADRPLANRSRYVRAIACQADAEGERGVFTERMCGRPFLRQTATAHTRTSATTSPELCIPIDNGHALHHGCDAKWPIGIRHICAAVLAQVSDQEPVQRPWVAHLARVCLCKCVSASMCQRVRMYVCV